MISGIADTIKKHQTTTLQRLHAVIKKTLNNICRQYIRLTSQRISWYILTEHKREYSIKRQQLYNVYNKKKHYKQLPMEWSISLSIFHMDLVSRYQNVSILDAIEAKDDGDGEWWQLEL